MFSFLDFSQLPLAIRPPPSLIANLLESLKKHCSTSELETLDTLKPLPAAQLQRLLAGSRFAAEQLTRHPQWLIEFCKSGAPHQAWNKQRYLDLFAPEHENTEQAFHKHLRVQRNRAMVRIIWRDFNRIANMQQTTAELSLMADAAIQSALDFHFQKLSTAVGQPLDENGNNVGLQVLGMGKLGASELNLSSDVDLIFAYPSAGQTDLKKLSNQEFFSRLSQKLIQSLDQLSADGFVFRVDMRLRPYGQSGAIVSSFAALEDYYQTQGREWERFAMIKARIVAAVATPSAEANAKQLMEILRSFTYRRYLDYTAIEALRDLKQRILREVKRRKLQNNIKLGAGGIREIEFIAQAFQIIRGGRDTELQCRQLMQILPMLRELECLPKDEEQALEQAYIFLRNTEHAIQGYDDKQTQELPSDEAGMSRVAFIMGYKNPETFLNDLEAHRQNVSSQFAEVIAASEDQEQESSKTNLPLWEALWQSLSSPSSHDKNLAEDLIQQLNEHGIEHTSITHILQAPAVMAMDRVSQGRFDHFMPKLLSTLSNRDNADDTLQRITPLVTSVARRSAYLLLLIENPRALEQLITLSEASPWIAAELAEHPALLDELLSPQTLYSPPNKAELERDLQQHMLRVDENDMEGQLDGLRYFRKAHGLRVAACEVTDLLPLMKVSDYLTELAEVICEYALQLSWREVVKKHGYPDGQARETPEFIIVGYGKLGGIELGHNSDLDLVFIHNANTQGSSSGVADKKGDIRGEIDNLTFYTRLGQKVIHYLSTRMPSGQLYEVDMRLRPSGKSGLLTTSLNAYEKYQMHDAWTWEHQALVRARAIAGDPRLVSAFNRIRSSVLCQERDLQTLREDVIEMRQKMRQQLGSKKQELEEGLFHLKQDKGGIVDIEFMAQFAVLAWAHSSPELARYTDNIRILESLSLLTYLDSEKAEQLTDIYKRYRSIGHRRALQHKDSRIAAIDVERERAVVEHIWKELLG